MLTTDLLKESSSEPKDVLDAVENQLQVYESSSSSSVSEISLSEKIVLESNEKRLRRRMSELQTSIMNLKEQLQREKELWREDIQKIRDLQNQQFEMRCSCHYHKCRDIYSIEDPSRSSSIYSLIGCDSNSTYCNSSNLGGDVGKTQSIKQLLELQNYKRKITETENMCNMELLKVKQSLQDLKILKSIACEWGRDEKGDMNYCNKINDMENTVHEIYMCDNSSVISNTQ